MDFEFDPEKSAANRHKHGIDFEEARALWEEPMVHLALSCEDEPRFMAIGRIREKLWTACITYRGDNVRIISVRRARENEKVIYENEVGRAG